MKFVLHMSKAKWLLCVSCASVLKTSAFCPHNIFIFFVFIFTIYSCYVPNSTNLLMFVAETHCFLRSGMTIWVLFRRMRGFRVLKWRWSFFYCFTIPKIVEHWQNPHWSSAGHSRLVNVSGFVPCNSQECAYLQTSGKPRSCRRHVLCGAEWSTCTFQCQATWENQMTVTWHAVYAEKHVVGLHFRLAARILQYMLFVSDTLAVQYAALPVLHPFKNTISYCLSLN
jgi:hypothetical protein